MLSRTRVKDMLQFRESSLSAQMTSARPLSRIDIDKTKRRHRITKGKRSKHAARCAAAVVRAKTKSIRPDNGAPVFIACQSIAFNSDAKVAMEKISRVDAATPGMVNPQVAIVAPCIAGEGIG